MKKDKRKSLVKSARKTVREDIKQSLIAQMKEVVGKMGQGSKKLNKEIEKGSKQLAKKLSKELKINQVALLEARNDAKVDDLIKVSEAGSEINPEINSAKVTSPAQSSKPIKVKSKTAKQKAELTNV